MSSKIAKITSVGGFKIIGTIDEGNPANTKLAIDSNGNLKVDNFVEGSKFQFGNATFQNWTASTTISLNTLIKPSTSNKHIYKCITTGNTGTTEPIWPTTSGATVNDSTVVWKEAGGIDDGNDMEVVDFEEGATIV